MDRTTLEALIERISVILPCCCLGKIIWPPKVDKIRLGRSYPDVLPAKALILMELF